MDCKKCMEQMSLHMDNMADGDDREFRQHLRSCKKCRTVYERMTSTREHLGSLEEAEVPEGFHDAWIKAAREQAKTQTKRPNLKWVRIAGPIAAALVVAVVGWQMFANGIIAPRPQAPMLDSNLASAADERQFSAAKIAPEAAAPTPAPTAAATMAPQESGMVGITGGQGDANVSFGASAPTDRKGISSYTITAKPESQKDLQDLLNQWNVSYAADDLGGTTRITFTIGQDHYSILMDWLRDTGAQPPPPENPAGENTETMQFEILFN